MPKSAGMGGTSKEAPPPCKRAKCVSPMVPGMVGSEKAPRAASAAYIAACLCPAIGAVPSSPLGASLLHASSPPALRHLSCRSF